MDEMDWSPALASDQRCLFPRITHGHRPAILSILVTLSKAGYHPFQFSAADRLHW